MPIKLNISEKGKAWKLEVEGNSLIGKFIGDSIKGSEIKPELEGYELEISGGSDNSGFPLSKDVEGSGTKKLLLKQGWGMREKRDGLRRRKTVRGKEITNATAQINMKVVKSGTKKLVEIFPEQNAPKQAKKEAPKAEAPAAAA